MAAGRTPAPGQPTRVGDAFGQFFDSAATTPASDALGLVVRVAGAGAAAGGTSMVDETAFAPGGSSLTPVGYFVDEVSSDTAPEGATGIPRMSLSRVALANLRDNTGALEPVITNTTPGGSDYALVVRIAGSAAGGTSSNFGSAIPSSGTAAGFSDGTNMQLPRAFDADSGGGTQYVLGVNLRQVASGGSVEAAIAANPLRTDPTGTTAQPVTNAGTFAVQAAQSGTWNITNVSGTVSLPTGASTAAKQPALGTAGTASADVITVQGIAAMTPLLVTATQSGTWNVGTVTTITNVVHVDDNSGSLTVDNAGTFAVQAAQSGTWTVQPGNTANTTAWKVDGSAVTQPVSLAAAATAIAKAEDVASADADVGVPAMAVRKATPANTSGTDGDYEMLQISAGRLWVDPSGVTLTVASHAVTNAGTFAVQAAQSGAPWSENITQWAGTAVDVNSGNKSAGTLRVVIATDQVALTNALLVTATGNIASDSVDSGNPLKIGFQARTTDITAVADADRVDGTATTLGKQIVVPYATPALTWNYAAAAGGLVTTSGVTAKAAGTGSQRQYITSAQIINSHQTIGTEVLIRDGAGGTVLWRGWAQFGGGGAAPKFDPPLRGTAATLVEIAEVTTTATAGVLVNLQGYTAAE